MGSSKDPHKVSHFLPPETIATSLGPLSSQNLDTSLPSEMHPNKQKYKSEKETILFWLYKIIIKTENTLKKKKIKVSKKN